MHCSGNKKDRGIMDIEPAFILPRPLERIGASNWNSCGHAFMLLGLRQFLQICVIMISSKLPFLMFLGCFGI